MHYRQVIIAGRITKTSNKYQLTISPITCTSSPIPLKFHQSFAGMPLPICNIDRNKNVPIINVKHFVVLLSIHR